MEKILGIVSYVSFKTWLWILSNSLSGLNCIAEIGENIYTGTLLFLPPRTLSRLTDLIKMLCFCHFYMLQKGIVMSVRWLLLDLSHFPSFSV